MSKIGDLFYISKYSETFFTLFSTFSPFLTSGCSADHRSVFLQISGDLLIRHLVIGEVASKVLVVSGHIDQSMAG